MRGRKKGGGGEVIDMRRIVAAKFALRRLMPSAPHYGRAGAKKRKSKETFGPNALPSCSLLRRSNNNHRRRQAGKEGEGQSCPNSTRSN